MMAAFLSFFFKKDYLEKYINISNIIVAGWHLEFFHDSFLGTDSVADCQYFILWVPKRPQNSWETDFLWLAHLAMRNLSSFVMLNCSLNYTKKSELLREIVKTLKRNVFKAGLVYMDLKKSIFGHVVFVALSSLISVFSNLFHFPFLFLM